MPVQHLTYKIAEVMKMVGTAETTVRKAIAELDLNPERVATDKASRALLSLDEVFQVAQYKGRKKLQIDAPLVISVFTPKGGVGKSSLSRELGCDLSLLGLNVLFIDADEQGSLSQMLGYKPDEIDPQDNDPWMINGTLHNLLFKAEPFAHVASLEEVAKHPFGERGPWLVPADITLGEVNFKLWNELGREVMVRNWIRKGARRPDGRPFDVIIFDNAPATSNLLRPAATVASDILLVPVALHDLGLKSIDFLSDHVAQLSEAGLPTPTIVAAPNYYKKGSSGTSRSHRLLERLREKFGETLPITPYVSATERFGDALGSLKIADEDGDSAMLPLVYQHRNAMYRQVQEEIRAVTTFLLQVAAQLPQRSTDARSGGRAAA